jgi:hypothetical protein
VVRLCTVFTIFTFDADTHADSLFCFSCRRTHRHCALLAVSRKCRQGSYVQCLITHWLSVLGPESVNIFHAHHLPSRYLLGSLNGPIWNRSCVWAYHPRGCPMGWLPNLESESCTERPLPHKPRTVLCAPCTGSPTGPAPYITPMCVPHSSMPPRLLQR